MNFEKAFKELLAENKIRRKEWESFMHLKFHDGTIKTFKGEYTNFNADADILISKGWLVIDGDGTELTFIQAIEQLKNKKSITHKDWIEQFIFVDSDQIALCRSVAFEFMPTYKCLCSNDWEIMS